MNHKQQFRQILETEHLNCKKAIKQALSEHASESEKNNFSLSDVVSPYSISEVQIFPFTESIIRNSYLVTAYSFFEYSLRKFCEVIACDHAGFRKKLSSMDKVYQYYSLISNILPVSDKLFSEDWEKLTIYREIRNIIVHHNSIVPGNTTLKTKLYLDTEGLIQIKESLIIEILDVSQSFLLNLIEVYDHKNPAGILSLYEDKKDSNI